MGEVVGRVDKEGAWSYRRAAQRPLPGDNGPRSAAFNKGLASAHEENLRRLEAEREADRSNVNPARVELIAVVDERLRDSG